MLEQQSLNTLRLRWDIERQFGLLSEYVTLDPKESEQTHHR
jgi:hypothetical protein